MTRPLDKVDIRCLVGNMLEKFREDPVVDSVVELTEEEWNSLAERILLDLEPRDILEPVNGYPFTGAHPFFNALFDGYLGVMTGDVPADARGTMDVHRDRYEVAAQLLQQNPLWTGMRNHVFITNDTACRTAIDTVVLAAIDLAQKKIMEKEDLDDALFARHKLVGSKRKIAGADRPIGSWVTVHQKVKVPNQRLLAGIAFHGILDYVLEVTAMSLIGRRLSPSPDCRNGGHLSNGVYGPDYVRYYLGNNMATTVMEAKSLVILRDPKTFSQVAAQGAALCVMSKRPAIVTILTDGLTWKFIRVTKKSEATRATGRKSSAGSSSARARGRGSKAEYKTKASRSKRPKLESQVEEDERTPPFKTSQTPCFDVFADLPLILRLLTRAITSPAEEFERTGVE